jgi:thiamine biosynthesis protein ThiI
MYNNIMISIDELWLKGRNRPLYFKAILRHIDAVIKSYHPARFQSKNDSQRLNYSSEIAFGEDVIKALCFIPGIALVSPVKMLPRTADIESDLEELSKVVLEECSELKSKPLTFRTSVRRIDKRYPILSIDLERRFGIVVLKNFPLVSVELKRPDMVLDIRVMPTKISVCTKSFKGIGGLPWDTSGHGLCMLSGGFDSPVASYMMLKRGLRQSYVFFHAFPFVGNEVKEKIKNLVSELAKFQKQTHLYIIPFGDIQTLISKNCKEEYRTIFFRKYMVEASNLICDRIEADALITGDSLGQVSSQTLTNMTMVDKNSKRLILRPLVGFNKAEVLKLSEQIGTHDISIIPHDDACALFAPQNPVINPSIDYWNKFEESFSFTPELNKAIDNAEIYSVNLKGELFKKEFFSFDSKR